MKRPRTGHVRPNLQGQAGIFQGVVPADVVDPLMEGGKDSGLCRIRHKPESLPLPLSARTTLLHSVTPPLDRGTTRSIEHSCDSKTRRVYAQRLPSRSRRFLTLSRGRFSGTLLG